MSLTPQDLLAADDATFRSYVDRDIRGGAPEAHDSLRSPLVVNRWLSVLGAMFRSVESQLASRRASHNAELVKLRAEGADETAAVHAFERSRSGSLRFKAGMEETLAQARFLRDHYQPEIPLYKAERDDLLRKVARMEAAIERHRDAVLRDEPSGPTDEALWALLPAEEIL